MNDTLRAFAAHCDRMPLTKRPTVWCQFIDIWGDPRGELGVPDPEPAEVTHTAFALLAPWVIVPTIGEVWLVVDCLEFLNVVHLHVNVRGMFDPHWTVDYLMDDAGTLVFGEWEATPTPAFIGHAVQAAKRARMAQTMWEHEHTIATVMPVVEGLLNR